ncbi:MAG: DUF2142 domain-containing protein [Deltaproteobacteria bacterium]|nr:DUF2142 domain-containing protein [Deltaproteobacteria bacterium]MCB9788662.1 DUF2142 domain-containing protein [Deltaproteobacteria bacterium]
MLDEASQGVKEGSFRSPKDGRLSAWKRSLDLGTLLALTVFAVLLGLNAARYHPFISDDALISLRYAARLLDGRGLTWASGPAVEGYSNLLWTLSVAALGALGVDLIVAARLLGAACMLVVAAVIARPRPGGRFELAPLLGLSMMALTAPVAVWTIGGLEQPMVAALLAVALAATFSALADADGRPRQGAVAAVAFGLLCLTRPDGPIFVVATVGAIAAWQWRGGHARTSACSPGSPSCRCSSSWGSSRSAGSTTASGCPTRP